ncbi:MAG: hypothetical protein IJY28_00005 [Clostridia bacterium]|nr:hypothetical protein [Clostridia bacterium]
MISFSDITKLLSCDLEGTRCIEIEFRINGHPEYQSCWMGKMPAKEGSEKDLYWYGLAPDGSEAYDYGNFQDFASAPVFDGQSLKEIWKDVEILSIDGCELVCRILPFVI